MLGNNLRHNSYQRAMTAIRSLLTFVACFQHKKLSLKNRSDIFCSPKTIQSFTEVLEPTSRTRRDDMTRASDKMSSENVKTAASVKLVAWLGRFELWPSITYPLRRLSHPVQSVTRVTRGRTLRYHWVRPDAHKCQQEWFLGAHPATPLEQTVTVMTKQSSRQTIAGGGARLRQLRLSKKQLLTLNKYERRVIRLSFQQVPLYSCVISSRGVKCELCD